MVSPLTRSSIGLILGRSVPRCGHKPVPTDIVQAIPPRHIPGSSSLIFVYVVWDRASHSQDCCWIPDVSALVSKCLDCKHVPPHLALALIRKGSHKVDWGCDSHNSLFLPAGTRPAYTAPSPLGLWSLIHSSGSQFCLSSSVALTLIRQREHGLVQPHPATPWDGSSYVHLMPHTECWAVARQPQP